jgi:hypothetical protein
LPIHDIFADQAQALLFDICATSGQCTKDDRPAIDSAIAIMLADDMAAEGFARGDVWDKWIKDI